MPGRDCAYEKMPISLFDEKSILSILCTLTTLREGNPVLWLAIEGCDRACGLAPLAFDVEHVANKK